MKIRKLNKKFAHQKRFAKFNEAVEDETSPVDEVPAEVEEPADEGVTITLTPEEVSILQKIVGMVDGSAEEAPIDDVCPGCDDPDCPDCGGAGEVEGDEFEIPDLSGMEPDEDPDDSAYFA